MMLEVKERNPIFRGLASEVRDELLVAPPETWDRYNNPFEQKYVLRREHYTEHMHALVRHLNAYVVDLDDCEIDFSWHYTAFFKYNIGDYLDLHMDAGVHPVNGKRKAWTLLYYLSTDDIKGGMLEFWKPGDGSLMNALPLDMPVEACEFVEPGMGTTVLFKNIDNEYHGNPTCVEAGTRMVCTLSFLSDSHEGFENMRERAYFVPRAGLRQWDAETYRLRDLRASKDGYREVYSLRRPNAA